MRITITKGQAEDHIHIGRADGTGAETTFPKKGPVPHDAVHVIVERALGLRHGFWGMIADGIAPVEVQAIAKAAGHASASRADVPQSHIVELIQAERLVECFEAALWDGAVDPATFRDIARAACESSHVAQPPLDDDMIRAVDAEVRVLRDDWITAPVGAQRVYVWPDA
jgi:hypothetical protein